MNKVFEDLIIFEMANNHQGDVEHGIAIINKLGEVAKKYGINAAVKFQYRDLDTMIHPDYKDREDVKHIPRFMSTRLTNDQFYQMVKATKDAGLHTMCTAFDENSVDLIMEHGIEIVKVASCSAIDWPLLEKIVEANKPVIISTGGKDFSDIDSIYSFFSEKKVEFALLHCVGMYPVKEEDIQLNCMSRMKKRYSDIVIGYSGHEAPNNYSICQMAIAMGASILERHVGLATDEIKLNAYSTDVNDVYKWIEAILSAKKICGSEKEKVIPLAELQSMNELARGCYVAKEIKKGQKIKRSDVFFAMPCKNNQTTSGNFVEGMIASKDYSVNEALYEENEKTLINDVISIIHDIKGMLYEARIIVGDNCELELSHHYGMEHFRKYGASILNIINREYCKKLVIVLPGQEHPNHYHKIKEETFHVLQGVLTLSIDGVKKDYRDGEIVTIERGAHHSFTSSEGCIFEEVSTTHIMEDSYYEDPRIMELDVMQRKTKFDKW